MYFNGSKVLVILFSIVAFVTTTAAETITKKQSIVNDSFELKAFKDFLDFNHMKHAIIIYSTTSIANNNNGCKQNESDYYFTKPILLEHLTENYHLRLFNTLSNTNFENLFYYSSPKVGVFMKYSAKDREKENIMLLASINEKFNNSLAWFITMEDGSKIGRFEYLQNNFGHLNFMLNADVTVAFYCKEYYNLELYDIYKICHDCGLSLEIEYKGKWSIYDGFKILNKFRNGFVVRRNNLKNINVNAASTLSNKSPDLNMTDLEYLSDREHHMEEDTMQRKTYQLLKFMEPLYNLTFNVTVSDRWGNIENGSWTGVIGLLVEGHIDLSLCPLRIASNRISALTYSPNVHTEKVYFLLRHPKHSSIRNIFFEPLADIVWLCILALIVVTILLLFIHVHTEYKLYWKMKGHKHVSANGNVLVATTTNIQAPCGMIVENSLDFIVLCIMEAILMQGPEPELFLFNSTRLLILSISVFSILLMQFYGAFIVSSLLSEAPRTITNLAALYNSSLEIGMENILYNYDVFINTKNQLIQNVYKYRICNRHSNHHNNIISLEEGVKRIGRGNFAFHVAVDRAYRLLKNSLTESQFCDLQEIIGHHPFTFTTSLGIRKSSPYREFITRAVTMFRESSLLQYNDKKWEVDKIDCKAIQNDDVEVDLEHFAPALAFLTIAIITSMLIFFIEIIYKHIEIKKIFYKKIKSVII